MKIRRQKLSEKNLLFILNRRLLDRSGCCVMWRPLKMSPSADCIVFCPIRLAVKPVDDLLVQADKPWYNYRIPPSSV